MKKSLLAATAAVLAVTGSAQAGIDFTILANGESWNLAQWAPDLAEGTVQEDGSILYAGEGIAANGWLLDFTIVESSNASLGGVGRGGSGSDFVVESLVVTNTTGGTLAIETTIGSSIPGPGITNAFISGSAAGTLSDTNNSGAAEIAVPAGDFLYTALVDGSAAGTLGAGPFSVATGTSSIAVFGPLDLGTVAAPDVLTSLGIRTRFDLTSGDTATYQSTLTVLGDIIPSPGSAALLAGAGLFGAARRRRA